MKTNFCLKSDSYKFGHWAMLPEGTQFVHSYYEARTGAKYDKIPLFGLQSILKTHFEGQVVTQNAVNQARLLMAIHFGQATVEKLIPYILNAHLPLFVNVPVYNEDGNVRSHTRTINPDLVIDWDTYFKATDQKEVFNIKY